MSQFPKSSFLRSNKHPIKKLIQFTLLLSTCLCNTETTTSTTNVNRFSTEEKWIYGFLTGFALGLIGFVCAGMVVCIKQKARINFNSFLKTLISFAAGALIGDAVVHLIPSAFEPPKDSSGEVDPRILSLFIAFGLVLFAIFERLFLVFGIVHNHGAEQHSLVPIVIPSNILIHNQMNQHVCEKNECVLSTDKQKPDSNNVIHMNALLQNGDDENIQIDLQQQHIAGDNNEVPENDMQRRRTPTIDIELKSQDTKSQIDLTKGWKYKKVEAYLNQMSDFLHNIMDGIALGVAFSTSEKQNVATTIVAIFSHEIPQEMGNASILLNSNFSGKQALMCNGCVNFSGIIGIIIGILVSSVNEKSEKIMNCFIAGNFLYIGATEMLSQVSKEKSNKIGIIQIFGLCSGFGVMFLLLLGE